MTSKKLFCLLLLCSLGSTACSRGKAPHADADAAAPAASPTAAPAVKAAPAGAAAPFDVASVPVSQVALPPFPYLDWPRDLDRALGAEEKRIDFQDLHLLAGDAMRTVEGRFYELKFSNEDAKYSPLASRRNYEAAIKALGGVKINTVDPRDDALVKKYGDRLSVLVDPSMATYETYDAYLMRTADRNIWMTVTVHRHHTMVRVLEEKPMEQTVAYVKADAMRSALESSGHIALYINFDTDKATLRADGQPAVDEIAALLKNDPALKLTIEGHTDNSGDAAHNKTLSQQRADTVMAALVAGGIDQSRLKAVGVGAAKPIADNAAEAGRAKNRRVELVKA
jgi:OOP family OmpA-OmpF porin